VAPKNIEEAIVERIQRAVRRELKALRRRARPGRNGHTHSATLARQAERMAIEAMSADGTTQMRP
jgi:hypothetical protein